MNYKSKTGFTLIELTVTMIITILLTSILVLTTASGVKTQTLRRAADVLAQDLHFAQESAMAGRPLDCAGEETRVFGVYFKKEPPFNGQYIIFGDCDGSLDYDETKDVLMRIVNLEKDIEICELETPPPVFELNVVFAPPEPAVYLNGGTGSIEAIIALCLKGTDKEKRIRVNNVGRIIIE